MKKLTKKQQAFFLSELSAEAEELTGSASSISAADSAWSTDPSNRSHDSLEGDMVTVERAILSQLAASTNSSASQVMRALQKLEDGTYGRCDQCGNDIGIERLEARPRSVYCVKCA